MSALLACAFLATGCGSSGPATTEQSAIDNLRSVLNAYDSASPTDVASTGSACADALSGLRGSSLLGTRPEPGKDLIARQDVHTAYRDARQGFSDCASGAKIMDYALMARSDAELSRANHSLRQACANRG